MRKVGRLFTAFALAALSVGVGGCFTLDFDGDGVIDRRPPGGYETDYISCANGRDDDLDGRIDCQDEDCLMRGHCGEQIPLQVDPYPEDSYEACIDGVDNDEDGQFDCGDRGCQDIRELCCLSEFDDASCSDGIDNDGNGFADCTDFSCRNGVFVTVCEAESDCSDRIDNDGDRRTDCNDSDCADAPMCEERDCANGRDDDNDDLVDCEDPSCADSPDCPGESDCTDGVDNNNDSRTDCEDPTCAADPSCIGPEDTMERCSDGFSNDGDPYVDCEDFDCEAFCESEDTLEACMDGVDNDGNSFIDCADFGCSRSMDPAILQHCAEVAETTAAACRDGIDNDGNGYVDCDDNSCRFSGDEAIQALCEATFETCTDRRDNNNNGYTDCADFSCQYLRGTFAGFCGAGDQCPLGLACIQGICIHFDSPCLEGPDPGGNYEPVGDQPAELTMEERRRAVAAGCTDGLDNDADGFTDCEDWDCNYNPLALDAAGEPICRFAGGRTCVFGPRAGFACANDAECAGVEGACGPSGREGAVFVCP